MNFVLTQKRKLVIVALAGQLAIPIALLLSVSSVSFAQIRADHPDSARIITSDIALFWRAHDNLTSQMTRADSIRVLDTEYIKRASSGLTGYVDTHLKKAENLLTALGMLPKYLAAVRPNTLRLRYHTEPVRAALRRLEAFYPETTYPEIFFVIAGFYSQGTVSHGNIIIAAEMVTADSLTPRDELPPFLRNVDLTQGVLPCILVHELIHAQQKYAAGRTLLAQVMVEGVADFITHKAVGCFQTAASTYAWGDAHERDLWALFQQEMHGTDNSKWLYNGNIKDRPDQLGYWMGYQIAEAYYENAADKQQAIRELLNIQDFARVLDASRYAEKFK